MKKTSLSLAVISAKILLMLGAAEAMKSVQRTQNTVSRLRTRIETATSLLAVVTDSKAQSHLEQYIESAYDGLIRLLKHVDVVKLVADHKLAFLVSSPRHLKGIRTNVRDLASELTVMAQISPTSTNHVYVADLEAAVKNPSRAEIESDFASVVRNEEWLSTLLALGLQLDDPNVTQLQAILGAAWGSAQGKEQLVHRISRLHAAARTPEKDTAQAPAAQPAPLTAKDVTIVTVALDSQKLLAHPSVQVLNISHHDITPRIVDLVGAASLPVRLQPGQSIEAAAEAKLDALGKGLVARHAAIAAEKARTSAAAVEAQNQQAIEAVRKLGPLAAVLRANPDLLKQV